jgi:exodeoxyribonuclease V beta subunit
MATLKRKVMSDAGDDDGDAVETRLETDRDSVRIMTIHKSKGLQFPLVFCPLLWDKHFGLDVKFDKHRDWFCHDVGRGASEESKRELILPLGDSNKNTYSDQGMRELLGELVRVAYVAVTRAENYCRVLYGRFGNVSTQTSLNYLFGNQTPDSFIQCASLAENDPPETDSIQMFPVSEATVVHRTEPNPYRPPAEATCVPLEPYRLRNGFQVPKNWGILSFSSLAGHRDGEDKSGRGADEADADGSDVKSAVRDSSEASALPPGNVTGSCFHEIMEELDFTRICGESPQIWSGIPEIRALIEGKMRKFGLIGGNRNTDDDPLHRKRYAPLCAMIHHTLNTRITLGNKTFCLSEISPQDRIAEMDFFYEIIGGIKTGLLRETALSLLPDAFRDILKTDDPPALRRGGPSTGFMTGSIDLIFRVEGRYCFLDWKTNALPAYEERTLWRTMFRQGYALQYLIYSLALDRYLAQRLREYRFEDHFGGGIYAFVRGIESNGSGSDGILAHRIDPKIRSALEECIYGHHQVFDRRTQ